MKQTQYSIIIHSGMRKLGLSPLDYLVMCYVYNSRGDDGYFRMVKSEIRDEFGLSYAGCDKIEKRLIEKGWIIADESETRFRYKACEDFVKYCTTNKIELFDLGANTLIQVLRKEDQE